MGTLSGTTDVARLIAGLSQTPDRLKSVVGEAPDERLDRAREGEWPARTVLAHLRDDEFMVNRMRLERMLVEDRPELAPFDEKAWAASRYKRRDGREDILADFRQQRESSLAILRTLAGEQWGRTGYQPEYGTFDIHWHVEHWLEHDNVHVEQVRKALEGP
jgi:hypothetical protein